jgi:hypothetical protein
MHSNVSEFNVKSTRYICKEERQHLAHLAECFLNNSNRLQLDNLDLQYFSAL